MSKKTGAAALANLRRQIKGRQEVLRTAFGEFELKHPDFVDRTAFRNAMLRAGGMWHQESGGDLAAASAEWEDALRKGLIAVSEEPLDEDDADMIFHAAGGYSDGPAVEAVKRMMLVDPQSLKDSEEVFG